MDKEVEELLWLIHCLNMGATDDMDNALFSRVGIRELRHVISQAAKIAEPK